MISVGIDIGKFSVKVAIVEGSAKGFQVIGLDEFPLGQDPAKDQTLDIIEALRDINKRYVSDGTPVSIAARQNHISLRRRTFPFKERHKILKSLPFELEDDIPLSIENAVYEAKITHLLGGHPQVLAMACLKSHIAQIVGQTNDAHLPLAIVSSEAVAIANVFEEWREAPKELSVAGEALPEALPAELILNIGHTETVGAIIRDGYLLDSFVVDWGGKDLADLISMKYSIHYIEALKELRKKAFILLQSEGATREQIALSDILKTSIDDFATQLRLILLESESQNGVRIQTATLTGGVAGLRNLGPYLTQKLELAVNRVDRLPYLPQLDLVTNPKNEIAHIISIGLAAEGLRRPKNPAVNFLKGEFARQSESLRLFWDKWAPTMSAMGALLVVFMIWSVIRDGLSSDLLSTAQSRLKEQAQNVAGLTGRQASQRNIRKYVREQEQKVKQREVLDSLQGITSALDVLDRISTLAPAKNLGNLNVVELKVTNSNIEINGYADKANVISQLQNSLKSYAADGNVESAGNKIKVPPGSKSFSFRLNVDRRSGGAM